MSAAPETARRNPYVGPSSLTDGDPLYGRDREREELRDLLISRRLLLLHSPSGAGKTSLIQAGLVRDLTGVGFASLPIIRVTTENPSGESQGNRYVISTLLSLETGLPPEKRLPAEELRAWTFSRYVRERVVDGRWAATGSEEAAAGAPLHPVLIFDQFEEVLAADPTDYSGRDEFFRELGEALREPGIWALFAMREEYVAALQSYRRYLPTGLTSVYRLELLQEEAALDAIEKPCRDTGTEFTPRAASRLVKNLQQVVGPGGEPTGGESPFVDPMQLQVVCYQLWERFHTGAGRREFIREEDLAGEGRSDVDQALEQHYEGSIRRTAERNHVPELTVRRWIERYLITSRSTRGQVFREDASIAEVGNPVIEDLRKARLVQWERRLGADWCELTHDRLIGPILTSNRKWDEEHAVPLQRRARLWSAERESASLLLTGRDLREAEAWARKNRPTPEEVRFLEKSRAAANARAARLRSLLLGAVVSVLLGLLYSAFRVVTEAKADELAARSRDYMDTQPELALPLAIEALNKAETLGTRSAMLSILRRPAPKDLHQEDRHFDWLAVSADGKTVGFQDREEGASLSSARVTFLNCETLQPLWSQNVPVLIAGMPFTGSRGRLFCVTPKNEVVIWDVDPAHGDPTRKLLPAPGATGAGNPVLALAAAPAAPYGAGVRQDRSVVLWGNSNPTVLPAPATLAGLPELSQANVDVTLSSEGDVLVTTDPAGLSMWDLSRREFKRRLPYPRIPRDVRLLDTAVPAGSGPIRAVDSTGKLWLWSRTGGLPTSPSPGIKVDGNVTTATLSADGARLAIGTNSGAVSVWKVGKKVEPIDTLWGSETRVVRLAFSTDGRWLVSQSEGDRLLRWDLDQQPPLEMRRTVGREAQFLTFKRDGNTDRADDRLVYAGNRLDQSGITSGVAQSIRIDGLETAAAPDSIPLEEPWETLAISPDGAYLAGRTGPDVPLTVRELEPTGSPHSFEYLKPLQGTAVFTFCPQPATEPPLAAVEDLSGKVTLWWFRTRKLTPLPPLVEGSYVISRAFDSTGRFLALVAHDDRGKHWLRLWDVKRGGFLRSPIEIPAEVAVIAVRSGTPVVAVADGKQFIRLWDARTGILAGPRLTAGKVSQLCFSPQGDLLAAGSADRPLSLWSTEDWRPFGPPAPGTQRNVNPSSLVFNLDGSRLAFIDRDQTLRVWKLSVPEWPAAACSRATRNLTKAEWRRFIGNGGRQRTCPDLP